MTVEQQIANYINSIPQPKQTDIQSLHDFMLYEMPNCKLWFLDGRNTDGKIVANPNIGYGSINLKYPNNIIKLFYNIGISANTTGISIYFMGVDNKEYLQKNFATKIGKATITGYCIKFKKLKDINLNILKTIIYNVVDLNN